MQTHWSIWLFGLILLPLVAVLYTISMLVMYVGFYEWTFQEKYMGLVWRMALFAGACAIAYSDHQANLHGSDISELGRISMMAVQSALLWAASYYFLVETRLEDVVGGPDPKQNLDEKTLQNKVVLITGANAGIGKETARQLAMLGASKVILACRSAQRAQEAVEELMTSLPKTNQKSSPFLVLECDLGKFASVRNAVDVLKRRTDVPSIDILILNAGVIVCEQVFTQDGCETMMQANLLGHYLLTRLLISHNLLQPSKTKPPRVLHLTSSTHQIALRSHGKMDLEDLMCRKGKRSFSMFGQYSQSKLGNILLAKELARRYQDRIESLAIHPGIVRTEVNRNMAAWLRLGDQIFAFIVARLQKTVEQGAWCSVAGATRKVDSSRMSSYEDDAKLAGKAIDDGIPNGAYLQNGKVRPTSPYTYLEADARKLWDMCEKLVGLEQK